jgi:hypothetical protein
MKAILALSLLTLSGCTTVRHLSDAENGWLVFDHGSGDDQVYYCVSNRENGQAIPKCYEANNYKWPANVNAGATGAPAKVEAAKPKVSVSSTPQ